ncbi:MAG: hypothetical protein IPM77_06305 [Crocinitomicaceae bacterium]|nr:hypothetical protein [Crocinitomicaceae bacterium]
MKMLLVLAGLFICSGGLFGQYNDTLYYKSGMVKAVTVRQHDEKFLVYEYRSKRGKLVENRIPLDSLDKFVIYNEYGELVIDSSKPKKKEE